MAKLRLISTSQDFLGLQEAKITPTATLLSLYLSVSLSHIPVAAAWWVLLLLLFESASQWGWRAFILTPGPFWRTHTTALWGACLAVGKWHGVMWCIVTCVICWVQGVSDCQHQEGICDNRIVLQWGIVTNLSRKVLSKDINELRLKMGQPFV